MNVDALSQYRLVYFSLLTRRLLTHLTHPIHPIHLGYAKNIYVPNCPRQVEQCIYNSLENRRTSWCSHVGGIELVN